MNDFQGGCPGAAPSRYRCLNGSPTESGFFQATVERASQQGASERGASERGASERRGERAIDRGQPSEGRAKASDGERGANERGVSERAGERARASIVIIV